MRCRAGAYRRTAGSGRRKPGTATTVARPADSMGEISAHRTAATILAGTRATFAPEQPRARSFTIRPLERPRFGPFSQHRRRGYIGWRLAWTRYNKVEITGREVQCYRGVARLNPTNTPHDFLRERQSSFPPLHRCVQSQHRRMTAVADVTQNLLTTGGMTIQQQCRGEVGPVDSRNVWSNPGATGAQHQVAQDASCIFIPLQSEQTDAQGIAQLRGGSGAPQQVKSLGVAARRNVPDDAGQYSLYMVRDAGPRGLRIAGCRRRRTVLRNLIRVFAMIHIWLSVANDMLPRNRRRDIRPLRRRRETVIRFCVKRVHTVCAGSNSEGPMPSKFQHGVRCAEHGS